jgi:hypothetical protein
MFMGTRRAPTKAFDAWMEGAGGWNNAWTSQDRTDYYDVAPPTALDLLMWLEADRLRDLGPLMTLEKLDAQREVVRNERRQTSENTPYGKVELRLPELLYPKGHPYHHPVIGSHEDLEAATVSDVKQFFEKWYDPANASIVVAVARSWLSESASNCSSSSLISSAVSASLVIRRLLGSPPNSLTKFFNIIYLDACNSNWFGIKSGMALQEGIDGCVGYTGNAIPRQETIIACREEIAEPTRNVVGGSFETLIVELQLIGDHV